MLDLTHDIETPVLRLPGLIADTLERSANLDFIAPFCDAATRLEDVVRIQIRLLAPHERADKGARSHVGAIDDGAIALDTERIHGKHQSLLPVVKRAQQDLHVVVVEDLVAIRQGHGGTAVQLKGANAEMTTSASRRGIGTSS